MSFSGSSKMDMWWLKIFKTYWCGTSLAISLHKSASSYNWRKRTERELHHKVWIIREGGEIKIKNVSGLIVQRLVQFPLPPGLSSVILSVPLSSSCCISLHLWTEYCYYSGRGRKNTDRPFIFCSLNPKTSRSRLESQCRPWGSGFLARHTEMPDLEGEGMGHVVSHCVRCSSSRRTGILPFSVVLWNSLFEGYDTATNLFLDYWGTMTCVTLLMNFFLFMLFHLSNFN